MFYGVIVLISLETNCLVNKFALVLLRKTVWEKSVNFPSVNTDCCWSETCDIWRSCRMNTVKCTEMKSIYLPAFWDLKSSDFFLNHGKICSISARVLSSGDLLTIDITFSYNNDIVSFTLTRSIYHVVCFSHYNSSTLNLVEVYFLIPVFQVNTRLFLLNKLMYVSYLWCLLLEFVCTARSFHSFLQYRKDTPVLTFHLNKSFIESLF